MFSDPLRVTARYNSRFISGNKVNETDKHLKTDAVKAWRTNVNEPVKTIVLVKGNLHGYAFEKNGVESASGDFTLWQGKAYEEGCSGRMGDWVQSIWLTVAATVHTIVVKGVMDGLGIIFGGGVYLGAKALGFEAKWFEATGLKHAAQNLTPLRALAAFLGHVALGVLGIVTLGIFSGDLNKVNGDLERWVNAAKIGERRGFYAPFSEQPLFDASAASHGIDGATLDVSKIDDEGERVKAFRALFNSNI